MYTKTEEVITAVEIRNTTFKTLMDWKGNQFESSSGKTPEFMAFARMFRAYITKEGKKHGLTLASFNSGHFYCSGFYKNIQTGKFAYFSTDDVRGGHDGWAHNLLLRTANHEKDYTGGNNRFATIEKLAEYARTITE